MQKVKAELQGSKFDTQETTTPSLFGDFSFGGKTQPQALAPGPPIGVRDFAQEEFTARPTSTDIRKLERRLEQNDPDVSETDIALAKGELFLTNLYLVSHHPYMSSLLPTG